MDISPEALKAIQNDITQFSKSDLAELRIENMNSSKDRMRLYKFAQGLGLTAESHFYPDSTNKYFIVKKGIVEKQYDPNALTVDFVNFFKKYTDIPIPTSHPDHFDYYVEELDQIYSSKKWLQMICDDLKSFDASNELVRQNIGLYKKELWRVKQQIQNVIITNPEYIAFSKLGTSNLPPITTLGEPYKESLVGRTLISIDVRSANFQTLKHFCPGLLGGMETWSDFVAQFTNHKFLQTSKPFRTILVNEIQNGNLNKFAIIFINDVIESVNRSDYADKLKLVCYKNDEVIYEVTGDFDMDQFIALVNSVHNFFKIKVFIMEKLDDHNYYVCTSSINNVITYELKNVPKQHVMQVIKTYFGKPLQSLDFKYSDDSGNVVEAEAIV